MYFQQFQKIYYDFPTSTSFNDLQVLTDITTNVRFRKEVLENITLYDEYDILEGETPEMIAEKIYGNAELHWVIMLVNQRYDYLKDFPMSSSELNQYVIDTYGQDFVYSTHHYEKDGQYVEPYATLKLPPATYVKCIKGDTISSFDEKNIAKVVDITVGIENAVSVMMDTGVFTSGQSLNLKGVRTDNALGTPQYSVVAQFVVPTNGFIISDVYTPISNYEYELRINEAKRRIKIISPSLIQQVLSEFTNLVNP